MARYSKKGRAEDAEVVESLNNIIKDVDIPLPIHEIGEFANAIQHIPYPMHLRDIRLKIRLLRIAGVDTTTIAHCIGVPYDTLVGKFKQDLECGEADFRSLVTAKLVQAIVANDTRAIMYYLEKRGGWGKGFFEDIKQEAELTKEQIEEKLLAHGIDVKALTDES